MVYFKDAQVYLEQSTLLIQARPMTTRVTTKYTLPYRASTSESKKRKRGQPDPATLTLKTYDPASGACLKYRTDKGAEVGRLIGGLSRCARVMAALPGEDKEVAESEVEGKEIREEAGEGANGKEKATNDGSTQPHGQGQAQQKGQQPPAKSGSGGKKKKGKR